MKECDEILSQIRQNLDTKYRAVEGIGTNLIRMNLRDMFDNVEYSYRRVSQAAVTCRRSRRRTREFDKKLEELCEIIEFFDQYLVVALLMDQSC